MKNTLKNIINTWHNALYDGRYDNYFVWFVLAVSGILLILQICALIIGAIIGVDMGSWYLAGSHAGFIVGILISRELIGDRSSLGVLIVLAILLISTPILGPYPNQLVAGIVTFFICVISFTVVSYTIKHGILRKEV